MSFAPLEAVKNHPVLAVGTAVTAIALILLLSSSGSQTVSSDGNNGTADAAATDSANQLQGMLAGIQGQIQLAQIGAASTDQSNEAALASQNINAQTTNYANTLAAQIQQLSIVKQAETTQQANTLQAGVLNNQTAAIVQQAQIASNTSIATTQTFANALVAQGQQTVDVAAINAQGQVGVANASRPCSSYLFGLFTDC